MGNGGHGLGPLAQGQAGQAHHAILRGNILYHGPGSGDHTAAGNQGDNVGLAHSVLGHPGGVKADKALSALGAVSALQEVHLAADAGQLPVAGALPVLLAHQVQLHPAVDADDVGHGADALGTMDVVQVAGVEEAGVLLEPVVEGLGAHGQIPGAQSTVKLLAGVG